MQRLRLLGSVGVAAARANGSAASSASSSLLASEFAAGFINATPIVRHAAGSINAASCASALWPLGLSGSRAFSSSQQCLNKQDEQQKQKPKKDEEEEEDDDKPSSSGREDEEAHPHKYFQFATINKFQRVLERAETGKASDGIDDSRFVMLYQTPQEQLLTTFLGQPLMKLQRLVATPLRKRVHDMTVRIMTNEIDGSFDKEEFLDGARNAFVAFYEALGAKDWAALKEMASKKVVDRLRMELLDLESEIGVGIGSIDINVHNVELAGTNLWSKESVADFDPNWAEHAKENLTSESWATVTVFAQLETLVTYGAGPGTTKAKTQGGASASEGVSQVDIESEEMPAAGAAVAGALPRPVPPPQLHQRWGFVVFARGPLPKGYADQLDCPWKIMGFWS